MVQIFIAWSSTGLREQMNRFFIYKEYGARYEIMTKDVSVARQVMPQWETYQKGLETLASAFGSAKDSECRLRKALTMGDLLVKVKWLPNNLYSLLLIPSMHSLSRGSANILSCSQSFLNTRLYPIVQTLIWKSTAL
jgi:hypothetical protein